MAKLNSVKEKIREKGEAVKDWWDLNKWSIAKSAGETVLYGLVGYGIGSLYIDITGLRKASYTLTKAHSFSEGYKQGLTDAAGALKAPTAEPVVIQTK